jgi:hypothetical protein
VQALAVDAVARPIPEHNSAAAAKNADTARRFFMALVSGEVSARTEHRTSDADPGARCPVCCPRQKNAAPLPASEECCAAAGPDRSVTAKGMRLMPLLKLLAG